MRIFNPQSNQIPYYDTWEEVISSNFNENPTKFTSESIGVVLYGKDGIDEDHVFARVKLEDGREIWVYQDYLYYEDHLAKFNI